MPKRKPRPQPLDNRLVVALAYNGLCTFEFGVAVEIFGLDRPEMGGAWYRFQVAAIEPGPLTAAGGIRVAADGGLSLVEQAGTIIVPGWRGADSPVPERLLEALRRAHKRGARLLSFCSGVFVLAATGLLDGQRATTHWRYSERLARDYPAIKVQPDVLYVDEGNVLTAAGSAAGIDLSLHLIRRDWGPAAANSVARRLVVPSHRDGGQAQFIEAPVPQAREGGRLGHVLERMRAEPAGDTTLAKLARDGRHEPPHLHAPLQGQHRHDAGRLAGECPHRRARELLEYTASDIEAIATAAGFGSAATLRHHFRKHVKVSPSAYRRRFGMLGADAGSRLARAERDPVVSARSPR